MTLPLQKSDPIRRKRLRATGHLPPQCSLKKMGGVYGCGEMVADKILPSTPKGDFFFAKLR
jgi:hypothetical protein